MSNSHISITSVLTSIILYLYLLLDIYGFLFDKWLKSGHFCTVFWDSGSCLTLLLADCLWCYTAWKYCLITAGWVCKPKFPSQSPLHLLGCCLLPLGRRGSSGSLHRLHWCCGEGSLFTAGHNESSDPPLCLLWHHPGEGIGALW